ncbi:MAG: MATE family efflux transporter, partial [Bacteroidetes bacterium]
SVTKQIFFFAIPILLGSLFQQLYNVVDSIIVGKVLGKGALAAVGASFPIIFTLVALLIGVSIGFSVVISQYYGAKDIPKVKNAIDTMFLFFFGMAVVVTILGIAFSEQLFRILQLPENLMPQATSYLNIYMLGMIVFFGFSGINSALKGLGDSKTPLYFLIVSAIFNVVFDVLFVMVFHWGIEGAAWASILAQSGAFLTGILYLNKTHQIIQFSPLKLRFYKEIFIKSLKIGVPAGMQTTFVALGMMALLGIVNTFGTDVIAAYTAAGRIDALAMLPAMTFSQALSSFTGQNMGAKKIDRVLKGYRSTLTMTILLCLFLTAVIVLFGNELMQLFISDSNVIAIGKEYLVIVSSFYILFAIMFITNGL